VGREALFSAGLYNRDKPLPLSALFLTGAFSGACTSLVLTPVELVKCKIQVPATTSSDGMIRKAPTPLSVIREVFRHQGLKGFWNGQMGTLIRETGGSAAWFGSKETVTLLFHKWNSRAIPNSRSANSDLPPLPLWQQAVAGASAGMSYNFLFYPADTIKSRMQTSNVTPGSTSLTFSQEAVILWKQYGLKGLYRGCGMTVARSAPSSAFVFIVFDALKMRFHIS
jgi:ornithine carrier protein